MPKPFFTQSHDYPDHAHSSRGRVNLGLWISLGCLFLSIIMIGGVILGLSASYTNHHRPVASSSPEPEPIDFSQPAWAVTVPNWRRVRSLPNGEPQRHPLAPNRYKQFMDIGYGAYQQQDFQTALINFRRALDEKAGDSKAMEAIANTEAILQKQRDSQQDPE